MPDPDATVKRRSVIFCLSFVLAVAFRALAPASAESPPGATAPAGSITFIGENIFSTADGSFQTWQITRAKIDMNDPRDSVVEVEVEVASLDTGIARRDEHLRSADFFDVAKFPKAIVRVHDVAPSGESERGNPLYTANFDVQIRDVRKTVDGHFELTSSAPLQVEGRLTLNRVDFGIGEPASRWNPTSIKDEIPVRFSATIGATN